MAVGQGRAKVGGRLKAAIQRRIESEEMADRLGAVIEAGTLAACADGVLEDNEIDAIVGFMNDVFEAPPDVEDTIRKHIDTTVEALEASGYEAVLRDVTSRLEPGF